eukprot:XP_011679823.1 PREDICTED: syntaxin-binding protein 4 [Strongylocentrotus purpuratus]
MVSNERAVQLLRSASASNRVTLVVSRGPQTLRRFKRLIENQLARRSSGLSSGSASTSYTSSSAHRLAYPGLSSQGSSPTSSVESFTSADQSDNNGRRRGVLHIIVSKVSGLGLHLYGGSDHQEGPGIFIDRVMEGGDCYRDGRVRAQDQLVAINDQSLTGMTLKDAQAVVTRISLRSDLNSVSLSYIPSSRTPVNKDRDHTPSSHPSGISHSLSSPYQSPHPHSHHSSPQLSGMIHSDAGGQRSLPQHPSLSHHSPHAIGNGAAINVPHPHMQGNTPVPQSSHLQQSNTTSHSSESTMMGGGLLPERRSPAAGQPAPSFPPTHMEMNPHFQGNQAQMFLPSALPPHLQPGTYMEPKMTSTPEGVTTNGVSDRRSSVPLPPGGDPSPVLPPYNLSHYTNQPISFSASSSPAHSPVPRPHSRRLSIDPQVRLKIDKLQVALEYLGIHPSPGENQELLRRLSIDQCGMVPYGEFVAVAKQLFNMKLDDSNIGPASLSPGGYDVTDFSAPPPFQHRKLPSPPPPIPPPVVAPAPGYYAEMENLRKQRDDAIIEAEKLQLLVLERERSFSAVEDELQRIRKQAQGAIHESKALKSRVHLAEVAQQEARNMELDYEEVVVMLEDELNKLRSKVKKMPRNTRPEPVPDGPNVRELQNRLAVMGCELRKTQASKRTYEVATEKLLQFAEIVHEDLTEGPNGTLSNRHNKGENARRGTNGFRPPGYLGKHKGPIDLATEAKETVKAIKQLVESEPLPHGWEETYTLDGTKYYLNHVTQCTTWIHPLSGVNHLPSIHDRDDLPETRT